jgi:transcriptional regulator GlxA family with amidase domain
MAHVLSPPPPGELHPRIVAAVELLNAYPERRWTARALAREAGVSVSLLYGLFSAELGKTPMGYLRRVRVASAERLLFESDKPVRDVGETLGFVSESHFCRTFRRPTGISPLRFRKKNQIIHDVTAI